MDVYEFVFIVQMLAFIGILLAKLYNLFSMGAWYDIKMSFLLFIGALFAYGIGFAISILGFEELLFGVLLKLETWFLAFHLLFLLFELFFLWRQQASQPVSSYNALKAAGMKPRR